MAYIVLLILLFGVVYLITQPFRRRAFAQAVGQEIVDDARPTELLELEAARDAKYREIRDAELDHETGKLSDEDFDAINSTLRAEAVALLRALDEFHASRGGVEAAREAQGAVGEAHGGVRGIEGSAREAQAAAGESRDAAENAPTSYHLPPQ